MAQFLARKNIIVGVTGGIAAYKSADLVRKIREAGATVRVVMTAGAKEFITPLTMQAVSNHPVHDDLFDLKAEAAMGHIELARWADALIIAPATADFIGKLNHGEAHDLLTTLCLAIKAPIALAPAMNQAMWKNQATQDNIQQLQQKGLHIFGPGEGNQACGDVGPGRLLEPLELVSLLNKLFANDLWAGKKVIITAGPTREPIDPVRYLSNASSGKMGYALTDAFIAAGAAVTLISGPVSLNKPARATTIDVMTAQEMLQAVLKEIPDSDLFISVAAIADFRPKQMASEKIPKTNLNTLSLEPTEDILKTVSALAKRPLVVGFAAETKNIIANAKNKLRQKKLDMIIANDANVAGQDENEVTVLWQDQQQHFSQQTKSQLARELVKLIAKLFLNKEP